MFFVRFCFINKFNEDIIAAKVGTDFIVAESLAPASYNNNLNQIPIHI